MQDDLYELICQSLNITYQYPEHFQTEVINPLFDTIAKGELTSANEQCTELLNAGCTDIRVIVLIIYSSQVWLSKDGMVKLFPLSRVLLETYQAQLLPPEMAEQSDLLDEICDQYFGWLLRKISRKMKFLAQQQKQEWLVWLSELNAEAVTEIKTHLAEFEHVLSEKFVLTQQQSLNALKHLMGQIAEIDITPFQEFSLANDEAVEEPEIATLANTTADVLPALANTTNTADMSAPLQQLHQKLACFQTLVEKQDYIKASIVAEDITQTVDNFDPRRFFPALFKPFLHTQIKHWEALQTHQHQTIQPYLDLYHLDLNAFMALELTPDEPYKP